MAYDLIKISALPAATPDESQEIVVGVGDLAKRINYGDVKADMVGTSPTYTTDTEPYLMRRTAHTGVVGKCALNKLVGGSLGWNQLVQNGNFADGTTGWTATGTASSTATSGVCTLTKGSSAGAMQLYRATNPKVAGHKVVVVLDTYASAQVTLNVYWGELLGSMTVTTSRKTFAFIGQVGSGSNTNFNLNAQNVPASASVSYANICLYDLTVIFGSTIADYVYGLGSTNGIAWLSKYIDLGTYHAYDAGSIQSVQATAHVTKDADDNVIGNYPLGSDTLRGIPQLVSNKLAFDGDEKYPDGTIKRKYGSRAYQSGDTSDGATMITDGTTTVYKLATPTTESSTAYQKVQTIDADGTESFTTSSPVPVGHETQTADNILAALGWLGE